MSKITIIKCINHNKNNNNLDLVRCNTMNQLYLKIRPNTDPLRIFINLLIILKTINNPFNKIFSNLCNNKYPKILNFLPILMIMKTIPPIKRIFHKTMNFNNKEHLSLHFMIRTWRVNKISHYSINNFHIILLIRVKTIPILIIFLLKIKDLWMINSTHPLIHF